MSAKVNHSMSLANPNSKDVSVKQKIAVTLGIVGLVILTLATFNVNLPNQAIFLSVALGLITVGTII